MKAKEREGTAKSTGSSTWKVLEFLVRTSSEFDEKPLEGYGQRNEVILVYLLKEALGLLYSRANECQGERFKFCSHLEGLPSGQI